jgi:hypothetical protein
MIGSSVLGRLRRTQSVFAAVAAAGAMAVSALAMSPSQAAPHQAAAAVKTGPVSMAYIEVNNDDLLNVGKYTLASNGAPVFDVAVIFAANIHYDGTKAQLYFNPQTQAVLDNAATKIRPLQAKGIKVYLSVLGDHQGAGISNFPDQASAAAFADQLVAAMNKYGLDGIDFDDEYADYGANGTGQPNAWSFVYLVKALKEKAPDKGIHFYYYGPAASRLSYNGINAGDYLDASGNAIYGTWSVPNVPGLTKAELSPAAVDIRNTSSSTAASLASRTVSEGYGRFLTYNLGGGDNSGYISSFTQRLYGSAAVYEGGTATPGGGEIKNVSSGNCVTAIGDYTQAQVNACNGSSTQKWTANADGTVVSGGKCLDVRQSGTTSGTVIQTYTCNGSAAQKFTYDTTARTLKTFSGLCLDFASSGFLGLGPKVTVANTCTGSATQQWSKP